MQQTAALSGTTQLPAKKFLLFGLVILLIAGGAWAYVRFKPSEVAVTIISQQTLEQQYGLRVNLIGVTAAGGLVDVRMKIIDAEKARALLQDKKNIPALRVENHDALIQVDADVIKQGLNFENNASLFLLYPNAGNAVSQGTPVSLVFGQIQLEAIPAK